MDTDLDIYTQVDKNVELGLLHSFQQLRPHEGRSPMHHIPPWIGLYPTTTKVRAKGLKKSLAHSIKVHTVHYFTHLYT